MNAPHLTKLLTLFAILTLAVAAFAAVPGTINYQGYLMNTDGTPVSAPTSIRFSLYSSSPNRNNPVWQDTQSLTPANGIYSIELGKTKPITVPFDVPYYLGIKAGTDAEMALQALSSVPYARRAASVDSGTQTLQTGGASNVGLIVKGANGQTADLQQWQNSTGTAVASVSSVGDLTLTGNLNLPATTASTGIIKSGTDTLIHTYGTGNFFAGIQAGNLSMTGIYNTASGINSLRYNTTGERNTASGNAALAFNFTGSFNTAIGNGTLALNNSNNNTATGNLALHDNSSGANNTALGYLSGYTTTPANANTTGSNNTFIGANAGPGTSMQLTNATAIGANALVSSSNSLVLGGIGANAVKVGIGTTSPTEALEVVGNAKISGTQTSQTAGPSNIGLIVKGTVSQAADLQQWQNNAGAAVASVSPTGDLSLTGNLKLPATTSTKGTIMSGANTMLHTFGGDANFFAGVSAGNLTMSGASNTGVGNAALMLNSNGYDNTATGTLALQVNTTGYDNTATGAQALVNNTTGYYNTATGSMSMNRNLTGLQNTASGFGSLFWNTNGNRNTAMGESALFSNTTANDNTAVGYNALYSQSYGNSGIDWTSYNTAIGFEALFSNQPVSTSTGEGNTAVGAMALRLNTTGYSNSACGLSALYSNTTGNYNTALGAGSLGSNTTASGNTAVGSSALSKQLFINGGIAWESYNTAVGFEALSENAPSTTSEGIYNTALGARALKGNTSGFFNTANGSEALYSNTTGNNNTALGVDALLFNTTGNDNTASGIASLKGNTTGKYNTANGTYALSGNTTGANNTASGNVAGYSISTGSNNTFLGALSDATVNNLTNATAIGYNARISQNNSMVLGGTGADAVKVGIGTQAPTEVLDVVGNIRLNDKDIYFRGGSDTLHGVGFYGGGKALFASADVNGPVVYGNGGGALGSVSGGIQKIALSWNASNNVSVQGTLSVSSISTGSTSNILCSSAANSGVIQRCSSTRKLKENITDISLGLETVKALRPVSFTWKANGNTDIGFVAEEVAALQPVLAIYNEQGEPDGVKYANMSAVLVKAVQEQQAIIEQLKAELAELKRLISR